MATPDARPTSFLTLAPGTAVVDRFGRPVGEVERVLLHEDGGFDGIVVDTRAGRRFVDAPEVRRVSGGAVTLGVTASDVEEPGKGAPKVYGVVAARHDRTTVTEADRDAAVEALKSAFVADRLDAEELGERVAIVHLAESLDRLDDAIALP
jgi:hypothetical protein